MRDPDISQDYDIARKDPGVSGTLTPFCEICDPNDKGNFYFSNRSNITGLFKEDEDDLDEQEVFEE